ncbi:uncharacterized protein CCOS01_17081 [Colletotrichum costaricense]|uniref:Uncharacterized protein n=1 Tax=Colletotrichum costaricense TaxID=1209916 RepID=A0AAJ0DRS2_9PEZI|nr:uncharacterized protein CCOS01_17081 [Colletotrichum costaricense]KAK1503142.1 hypothetical protein CCOS01_17081 [Colletotrichum costaricense]
MASSSSAPQGVPDFNPFDALDVCVDDPNKIGDEEWKKLLSQKHRRIWIHCHPDKRAAVTAHAFPNWPQAQEAYDFLLDTNKAKWAYKNYYAKRTYPFFPSLPYGDGGVFRLDVFPNVNEPRKRGYQPTPVHLALDSKLDPNAEYLPEGDRLNPVQMDAGPGPSSHDLPILNRERQPYGPGLAPSPHITPSAGREGQPRVPSGSSNNPFVVGDSPEAAKRREVTPGRSNNPIPLDSDHEDAILDDPEAVVVVDEPRRGGVQVPGVNSAIGIFVGWPTEKMHIPVDLRPIVLCKFTTAGSFSKRVKSRTWKDDPVERKYLDRDTHIRADAIKFNDTFSSCMSESTAILTMPDFFWDADHHFAGPEHDGLPADFCPPEAFQSTINHIMKMEAEELIVPDSDSDEDSGSYVNFAPLPQGSIKYLLEHVQLLDSNLPKNLVKIYVKIPEDAKHLAGNIDGISSWHSKGTMSDEDVCLHEAEEYRDFSYINRLATIVFEEVGEGQGTYWDDHPVHMGTDGKNIVNDLMIYMEMAHYMG